MTSSRFLVSNGVVFHGSHVPHVAAFLQSHPGAYTTTRTNNNASCILFWERHMERLLQSLRILSSLSPQLLWGSNKSPHSFSLSLMESIFLQSEVQTRVRDSLWRVLPIALKERDDKEEFAISALVGLNFDKLSDSGSVVSEDRIIEALDVHVHVSVYVPFSFGVSGNGVHLAVVGSGRDVAAAKYSDWVRRRKSLEKLRPPSVTELLLSNNGDMILEGCLTNFFVVACKESVEDKEKPMSASINIDAFEVQTAPLCDGVLPGVIRQLVIEVCVSKGISFREVAPSWSEQERWEEAFVTSNILGLASILLFTSATLSHLIHKFNSGSNNRSVPPIGWCKYPSFLNALQFHLHSTNVFADSLRLIQHAEKILVPSRWDSLDSKTWNEISWEEKLFKDGPGMLTTIIQREITRRADRDGCSIRGFL